MNIVMLNKITTFANILNQCELLNWVTVLDKLDAVLEANCSLINSNGEESQTRYDATSNTTIPTSWHLACDSPSELNRTNKELLLATLHFSSLLIEHSFTRHLYSSTEHLTLLLLSCDMSIVLAVIDVLYVFSKRSNFITRLSADKKQTLITCLIYLAEVFFLLHLIMFICSSLQYQYIYIYIYVYSFCEFIMFIWI